MKKTIRNRAETLGKDEPITIENVQFRGEYVAIRAVKTILGKTPDLFMRKTHYDLLEDIHNIDAGGYVLPFARSSLYIPVKW